MGALQSAEPGRTLYTAKSLCSLGSRVADQALKALRSALPDDSLVSAQALCALKSPLSDGALWSDITLDSLQPANALVAVSLCSLRSDFPLCSLQPAQTLHAAISL